MKKNHKLVCVGDLHWGAVPPEILTAELDETLVQWLLNNEFDGLIQLGDYFDRRLNLESADAKAAFRLTVTLCQICQERSVPFRIVRGTLSHDGYQLDSFRALEAEYSMFRIVSSATYEELLPDFHVLFMPEEYPTDYNDYYSQFFFNEDGNDVQYDAIFGHGEIDVAANWSSMNEGERHYGGTPCHQASDLLEHCVGPVWFGHVHARFRYKKRLGYPGSFSRWCHGDESPKGFDVLNLSLNKAGDAWVVKDEVVENVNARIYKTFMGEEIFDMMDTPDEIVAKVRQLAEDEACTKLRVKLGSFNIGVEDLTVIRGALIEDRHIEIVSQARPMLERTEDESGEVVDEENGEERRVGMSYLRDTTKPGEERLLRYMHENIPGSTSITLDDVLELTSPLV